MIPEYYVFFAAIINFCATISYAVATLRGTTQPNRVTWFMWALAPLNAAAAQLAGGVGWSTLMVFMTGIGPCIIVVCSFVNKKAYWQTGVFDYLCGLLIGVRADRLVSHPQSRMSRSSSASSPIFWLPFLHCVNATRIPNLKMAPLISLCCREPLSLASFAFSNRPSRPTAL